MLYTTVGLSTLVLGGISLKLVSKIPALSETSFLTKIQSANQFSQNSKRYTLLGIDSSLAKNKMYDV